MLNYQAVKKYEFDDIVVDLTPKDIILYALGIGFGKAPLDELQLRYVYEKDIVAMPTIVSAIGNPDGWWEDSRTGVDYARRVHGEQHIVLHHTIPTEGRVIARNRVLSITDNGADKGAVAVIERTLFRDKAQAPFATSRQVVILRNDGGYSKSEEESDPPPMKLRHVPTRPPDRVVHDSTFAHSAILYRLSGDTNPLHIDPRFAESAGYSRPILHGLCTFGMAALAIMAAYCNYREGAISSMSARFTAPVYPGETIIFNLWEGSDDVAFEGIVMERNIKVLDRGSVVIQ